MESWKAGFRGTQVWKTPMKERGRISRVLIDDRSQSLFVETADSTLNQIDLRNQKMMKMYLDLKIGRIQCLSSFDNLLFVGGSHYWFTLIDIEKRRVLTVNAIKTPINNFKSAQFNLINWNNGPKVVITILGCKFHIIIFDSIKLIVITFIS